VQVDVRLPRPERNRRPRRALPGPILGTRRSVVADRCGHRQRPRLAASSSAVGTAPASDRGRPRKCRDGVRVRRLGVAAPPRHAVASGGRGPNATGI
jgi:hypothetical protein